MNIVLFCPCFLSKMQLSFPLQRTRLLNFAYNDRIYTEMLSSPQRAVSETRYRCVCLCVSHTIDETCVEKLIEVKKIPMNAADECSHTCLGR